MRAGGIKSREELEVNVDDPDTMRTIFARLGFALTLEYPKVRETWRLGTVEIALDKLPFGLYGEIEGPLDDIRSVADALGLKDPEPLGYPSLMRRSQANPPD